MSNETLVLRYEANSISTNLLSDSQKQAFEQIVRSLAEAVSDLKKRTDAEKQGSSHAIDSDRKSRTVMISGDRGTGKTTLMLTLQNSILNLDPEKNKLEKVKESCKTELNSIRGRVVWLEPLDMEHSSNTTNLFVSILARIDDAIKNCFKPSKCEKDYDYSSYGMSFTPIPGRDDILMELRRLQVDASIAWEGNLAARAPYLDSDAYATEVMRAERARMGLNRRFRELLDGIASQIPWGEGVKDPIFVLAVDDFDLNPARCLDILKLIRSLNVPRLFTLVLGDEEVAEEVFRLDIQGDISRIANVTIDAHDGISSAFIKRIKHISPQAVRKLVPPHQRLKLRYNTIEESLQLTPGHANQKIGDILKKFTLYAELPRGTPSDTEEKNPLKYSLYDFLIESVPEFMLNNSKEMETQNSATKRRYRYKGGRILETSIREVVDFCFSLQNIDHQKENGSIENTLGVKMQLISQIRKSMQRALYDDPLLDLETVEQFIYEFESDLDDEVFRTYNLELKLPLPKSHRIGTNNFKEIALAKYASISANFVEEFKLIYVKETFRFASERECDCDSKKSEAESSNPSEIRCSSNSGNSVPNNLSWKTQAHLTLLHDLVSTNPLAPIVGNYLVKPIGEYSIVTCDWNIDGKLKFCIPWRGAIFRTIRELEIFANSWDIFIESIRKRTVSDDLPNVEVFNQAWFYINLKVLLGDFTGFDGRNISDVLLKDVAKSRELVVDLIRQVVLMAREKKAYGSNRAKWALEGLFSNLFVGSCFNLDFCKCIIEDKIAREFYMEHISRIRELQTFCFHEMPVDYNLYRSVFFSPEDVLLRVRNILERIRDRVREFSEIQFSNETAFCLDELSKFIIMLRQKNLSEIVLTRSFSVRLENILMGIDSLLAIGFVRGFVESETAEWLEFSSGADRGNKLKSALMFISDHARLLDYAMKFNAILPK
jgi:hypothetical protein